MTFLPLLVFTCARLAPAQTLDVSAAASLHESFRTIAQDFERRHPGVSVHLSFGGSQQLAAQINQGAPCDVFASADQRNLDKVAYDPGSRRLFAVNRLVVVTPPDSPRLTSFRSLAEASAIVVAAEVVPAGWYARSALERAAVPYGKPWFAKVGSRIVSREQDVRVVLTKVELGEADAGIVYATDAASAQAKVRVVPIPDQFQPAIAYPAAVLKAAKEPHLARQFIKSVLDPPGQAELVARGFVSPLGPRNGVWLKIGSSARLIPISFASKAAHTVTATGPDKKPHRFTGMSLASLLGPTSGRRSITFTGADEYRVTLPLAQVLKAGAVLVPSRPGNLQVIIPGLPPHDWVDWLTEIRID